MDTERFVNEIVEPTIKDFEQYPTSIRHAFLACAATFHIIDYIAYGKKIDPATLRQNFRKESLDFVLVDRVAHAFKHAETGHSKSVVSPLKAEEVIARPSALWGIAVWDLSHWDDPKGGVTIKGEHEYDLLETVKRAVKYLRGKA